MKTMIKTIGIIAIATGLSACAGMSHTEKDTLVGAGTGAVAGGIIGHEVGEDKDRGYRR